MNFSPRQWSPSVPPLSVHIYASPADGATIERRYGPDLGGGSDFVVLQWTWGTKDIVRYDPARELPPPQPPRFSPDKVWDACNMLYHMGSLSGPKLRDAAMDFSRRYGSLAEASELPVVREVLGASNIEFTEMPQAVRQSWISPAGELFHQPHLPVWCYHHEGLELRKTIFLYQALSRYEQSGRRNSADVRGWIQTYTNYARAKRVPHMADAWDWTTPESTVQEGWRYLQARLGTYLRMINLGLEAPSLVWGPDREPVLEPEITPGIRLEWKSRSILGAIYAQLIAVFTGGGLLRQCEDSYCGQVFSPSRSDQIYCSRDCGNRSRVRRNYRKKKSRR